MKQRWIGKVKPPKLEDEELAAIVEAVLPGVDPKSLRRLDGGFSNWNFRVQKGATTQLLRVYSPGERCAWKEQRLAELLAPVIRTPQYLELHEVGDRVAAIREYEDGQALHEIVAQRAVGFELGELVGKTLGAVHQIEFEQSGDLDRNLNITEFYDVSGAGVDAYVRQMLTGTAGRRLGTKLTQGLVQILARNASRLDTWNTRPVLTHGDFGPTNLIWRRDGRLSVIDWEFGCAATPATDFGNLLRPPLEANESFKAGLASGYQGSGHHLPADWAQLALLADTLAWVAFASRPDVHEVVLADARARLEHTQREFA